MFYVEKPLNTMRQDSIDFSYKCTRQTKLINVDKRN